MRIRHQYQNILYTSAALTRLTLQNWRRLLPDEGSLAMASSMDLPPQEIERLAEEWVCYHAAFAAWYYRKEQAHRGYKSPHGLMLPMARKSIEPLPLALDGGGVQAMQPCVRRSSRETASTF